MYRRIFAFILAFVMVFSMVPVTAFAAEEEQKTEPVVTEPAEEKPAATEPVVQKPAATEPKAPQPVVTEPKATEAPVAEPKATEAPVTEPPVTEAPVTEPPVTEPPVTEPLATEPPATEPPVTEPPVTEPPVTEPPATEPPATEPPATEPPAMEPPVTEPPVTEPKKVTFIAANLVFEFPEDSGLTDANIGTATVILEKKNGEDWLRADQLVTTAANGWSAYFELSEGGTYKVSVTGVDVEGYEYAVAGNQVISLAQGENKTEAYTLRYTKIEEAPPVTEPAATEPKADEPKEAPKEAPGKKREGEPEEEGVALTVSLTFAEDSPFADGDVGDIVARISDYSGNYVTELLLTQENGRSVTVILPAAVYQMNFRGYEQDGYVCSLGHSYVDLTSGTAQTETREVNYIKDEAKLTVSLIFAWNTHLGDDDIGAITARVYSPQDELVAELLLTKENGRTATTILPSGWGYDIEFVGHEQEGYLCDLKNIKTFSLTAGEEELLSRTFKYTKDDAKLKVSLVFAEGSAFGDADIGDITLKVYKGIAEEDELVATYLLTQENGRTASVVLPTGGYSFRFSGHEKEGYVSGVSGFNKYISAEKIEFHEICELNYIKDEAELSVLLTFAEDSVLGDTDIGDVVVKIHNSSTGEYVKEVVLTQGEGRTGKVTLPSGYYTLKYSGHEQEGYVWELNEEEVGLVAGKETSITRQLKYVKDEATLTVSLTFAEGSVLGDADVGDIKAEVYDKNPSLGGVLLKTMTLTQENGRTATKILPSGRHYIEFSGYEQEGYVCEPGGGYVDLFIGEKSDFSWEVNYVKDEAELTVSLSFADSSDLGSGDVGDIVAGIYTHAGSGLVLEKELILTQENDRTETVTLPSGYYYLDFSEYEKDGYICNIYKEGVRLGIGEKATAPCEISYLKDEGRLIISLTFADDSALGDDDIGEITAKVYSDDDDNKLVQELSLTKENGRSETTLSMPSGYYRVEYSGYEKEGYDCAFDNVAYTRISAGQSVSVSQELNYTKNREILTVSLSLTDGSAYTDVDFEDVLVEIEGNEDAGYHCETGRLNSDGKAEFIVPSGEYKISLSGYNVQGYIAEIEDEAYITVTVGEPASVDFTLNYIKKEAKLTVNLTFDEDSAFGDEDIGDITAEIYDGDPEYDGELVGTILLPKGNRSGEVTVPADGRDDDEGGYWVSYYSYYLKITGGEMEGYRAVIYGADYSLDELKPGDEDGWNVVAKYVEAKHKVTVKVRLSEDSVVPAAELKDLVEISLKELDNGMVDAGQVPHTGSTAFSYTFDNLPASDCYRFNVNTVHYGEEKLFDVLVQSFTCTGDVLHQNLEEGYLDFKLDEDCEIEVVLHAKEFAGRVTVIACFTEDSVLQAKDFPQGITLTTLYSDAGGDGLKHFIGENVFSQENNWTKTIKCYRGSLGLTEFAIKNPPVGYMGVVTTSYDPESNANGDMDECLYAYICFKEYEPYYLDVELVFAEDSVLKGAEAGSISLDINDSGTERSFEFSEAAGWRKTLELHGDHTLLNDEFISWALNGLNRDGYSYTVGSAGESDFDWFWDRSDGIPLWQRGQTRRLVLEVCYTEEPGKLVVDIICSPNGEVCGTTITVTDANGNVVAKSEEDITQFITELPGAGTYTVSQTVKKNTENGRYYADGPKTIQFDPAKGLSLTLLNERRASTNLNIRKYFEDGSVLGPEDFPEGITVTLTETDGTFGGTYILNDDNGWSVNLSVPNGSYIVEETDADKDGFERSTWIMFAQTNESGGESLRDWGLAGRKADSTRQSISYGTSGGPYYVVNHSVSTVYEISIHNTYTRAGSISITAGEGFYEYPDVKLDGGLGSGYEAEEYTYLVNIGGQEQTVTVKAGETYVIDNIREGTEYTVTPVLPDGYAWNAETTPITGTIGSDTNDDSTWDVEIDFTNDYYYAYEDGVLTIIKTDAKTGETLEGAVFGLFADKACTKQVATATSGEDGICTFTFDKDSIGTYYIKELQAPTHYHVVSEEIRAVTVKTEWATDEIDGTKVIVKKITATVAGLNEQDGGFPWVNERRTGSITITAGDGFYIYGGDELPGNPGSGYEAEEYTYRVVIDGQEQTVTLKPGESITLKDIDAGSEYSITPALPKGYDWNADESTISGTIGSEDETDTASWNVEVDFENLYYYTYADGTVTIIKTDDLTGKPLKGAVFGFYSDRSCTKLVATATSGEDGICTFAVKKAGTYYIRELEAPADYYIRDRYVHEVTVKAKWETGKIDGTKVIKQKLTASVAGLSAQDGGYIWVNERRTTDLSVTKIFAHDENLERPKSVMIVLYQDGLVYDTVELSEANNWTHVWEKVPMGFEYVVDELDVAPGYYKQITRDGYDFTVVNTGALIPQTGDESMIVFWSAMALLSLCGMAFLMEKKRLAR